MALDLAGISPRNFVGLFKGRLDRVILNSRGKQISQQVKRGEFELFTRAEAHLSGSSRMGFYNMLDDFTVPWAQIVFNEGLETENPERDSALLVRELFKLGFSGARRETGLLSGNNFNVWMFFEPAVPAKKVRYLIYTLFEKLGFSKKLPVMPATDELSPGDLGQYAWLPYFNGVDKWFDRENNPYDGLGIKQGKTLFVDNNGNEIEKNFLTVPRNSERELDQALRALDSPMAEKYLPGVGLVFEEPAIRAFIERCEGFRTIVEEIETTGKTTGNRILHLGAFLRAMGQEEMIKYYLEKVNNYPEKKFEMEMSRYTGPVFPDCLQLKQTDSCSPGKICFEKTVPIIEHMGQWRENDKAGKVQEPTVAPHFFDSVIKAEITARHEPAQEQEKKAPAETPPSAQTDRPVKSKPTAKVQNLMKPLEEVAKKLMANRREFMDQRKTISGLNSGFESLNMVMDGIPGNSLIVLAGLPGAGKTTLARQIFDQVVEKEKIPALFITFCDSPGDLLKKTLCRLSGNTCKKLRLGAIGEDEWQKTERAFQYVKQTLAEKSMILQAEWGTDVSAMADAIKESGAGFVVIDYLEAVSCRENTGKIRILTELKGVARKLSIPILLISNWDISPEIEYNTDILLYLNSPVSVQSASSEKTPYLVYLNIEKNRGGIRKVTIQYTLFPPRAIFYNEKLIPYRSIEINRRKGETGVLEFE